MDNDNLAKKIKPINFKVTKLIKPKYVIVIHIKQHIEYNIIDDLINQPFKVSLRFQFEPIFPQMENFIKYILIGNTAVPLFVFWLPCFSMCFFFSQSFDISELICTCFVLNSCKNMDNEILNRTIRIDVLKVSMIVVIKYDNIYSLFNFMPTVQEFENRYLKELSKSNVQSATVFNYASCLVQSSYAADIHKGISLFMQLIETSQHKDFSIMYCAYFIALGKARIKVKIFLQIECFCYLLNMYVLYHNSIRL